MTGTPISSLTGGLGILGSSRSYVDSCCGTVGSSRFYVDSWFGTVDALGITSQGCLLVYGPISSIYTYPIRQIAE